MRWPARSVSGEPSSFSVGADQDSDADDVDPVADEFVTSIENGGSAVCSSPSLTKMAMSAYVPVVPAGGVPNS